jgi:hypothetical protein
MAEAPPFDPKVYVKAALEYPPEVLARYRAELHEALSKGAIQGPGAVWPDPRIGPLALTQTPASEHFVHAVLLLTKEQHAEVKAMLDATLSGQIQSP